MRCRYVLASNDVSTWVVAGLLVAALCAYGLGNLSRHACEEHRFALAPIARSVFSAPALCNTTPRTVSTI